jgi:large subunit ribosomal protein L24
MANMNIKKGDTVVVITGKDKGKVAEVLACFPKENRVTVKGVNVMTKHNKPKSAQDKGGIAKVEGKIQVSNVELICPVCGKATRVAHKEEAGKSYRSCKKCGANMDNSKKATKEAKPAAKAEETKEAAPKKTATKSTAAKSTTAKSTTKTTKEAK